MTAWRWTLIALTVAGWFALVCALRWWFRVLDAHLKAQLSRTAHDGCPICRLADKATDRG